MKKPSWLTSNYDKLVALMTNRPSFDHTAVLHMTLDGTQTRGGVGATVEIRGRAYELVDIDARAKAVRLRTPHGRDFAIGPQERGDAGGEGT